MSAPNRRVESSAALDRILNSYRAAAVTEREKGTYFENLAMAWLRNNPAQVEKFSKVWRFDEWAKERELSGKDTGIDLVAELRDEDGYAAIQCKFYSPDRKIQMHDVSGFLAASGKEPFKLRLYFDTTENDWSENAEDTIRDQTIKVNRIRLDHLRDSEIDWAEFEARGDIRLHDKRTPKRHQEDAMEAVLAGFETSDRGKLIMACGTGKTFISLKVSEAMAGKGKRVLFLAPSLALIDQSLRDWTRDTETPLRSFAVCSDTQTGKRRRGGSDDVAEIEIHDLEFPATTKPDKLVEKAGSEDAGRMTVVFGTYQSIPVITEAQRAGLPAFDLIICDEAHRTTGAKFIGEDESGFLMVHENRHVNGAKRLYMTATPRIFGDKARASADKESVELCSMDDEVIYGPTFFTLSFSHAVENNLLTDYKVVVLAVDETIVSRSVQNRLADADSELRLDDATKIIGCYKALQKEGGEGEFETDRAPMRRAIAFCKDINSSKMVASEFENVVNEFEDHNQRQSEQPQFKVEHVDGTFNAKTRGKLLKWLEQDARGNTCHVLSNARCLSEGVDVPALDAIMFLHPRKSQVDVVQSVGRVMRLAEGKKLGYVILPVVIPAGMRPDEALNDNERYRIVWQILNALRAHDDRFDATINKLELNNDTGGQIEIIAVADQLPQRQIGDSGLGIGGGIAGSDDSDGAISERPQEQINFIFDEFPAAIRAKIVEKCGRRTYWENWAKDVGGIARKHIERITAILENGGEERRVFDEFLIEIRDDLNGAVTEEDAIEMLAQHLVTKPVFDALFEDYDFASLNPVSQALQRVVAALEPQNLQKEAQELKGFYASVKRKAEGIDNAEGKQRIIVELYDKFFKTAFPKLAERLGIVYTPIEVVDFIIHSVNDILQQEFGQTLGSEGVHIIDPFTGTGTFITRLLQSGLIKPKELAHKFRHEIHANEIVLLAYYIAAVNVEAAYHGLSGGDYVPFEGICLTDTFEMYESDNIITALMADNSERRSRQKTLDIRAIMGNPPYSVGQRSAGDFAGNVSYKELDERIRNTFAANTTVRNKTALYDSYIRAIRWALDRIGDAGVVGFITGSAWVDRNFGDGIRKCLIDECTSLYVVNLRGDVRKDMLSAGAGK